MIKLGDLDGHVLLMNVEPCASIILSDLLTQEYSASRAMLRMASNIMDYHVRVRPQKIFWWTFRIRGIYTKNHFVDFMDVAFPSFFRWTNSGGREYRKFPYRTRMLK